METMPQPPLKGNVKREAVDSMRGYSYQILRSIEAWIDLGDGDVLALEGAEDLDLRLEGGATTAEQIKDTSRSGTITLRSQNVIEAIGNYWEHLQRNPGVSIRFRYLTTSGVGREKSKPLGFAQSGIDAWRQIQAERTSTSSLEIATGIQSFLSEQELLSSQLRNWLKTASVQDFIERIVMPIEWVTGWPEWRDLHAVLVAKLVELAAKRGIGSADAVSALDALHTEAWRIATTKGSRLLRKGDLLRILDDAGSTAVPTQQLLSLLAALSGKASGGPLVTTTPEPFSLPPRASPRRYTRPLLEDNIRTALSSGTVLVHGGTGMGKTGLAVSVTGVARPTAWVEMRGMLEDAAAARIDMLVHRLPFVGEAHDVVLDDLPTTGDYRVLEAPLGRLRAIQDRLGGLILVTHSDVLPSRIADQLSLSAGRTFIAPSFDEKDIENYLLANGCPGETANTWSKIIRAGTRGHPQFVDARVVALAEEGFPEPDISELLVPRPEILDVRAEARRLIASRPASDRELLARASLLLGRVPRSRLMAVAAIDPPIAEPGDVIDRVTGPWLERTESDALRPSPLLSALGVDTRGVDWAIEIHRGIAFSFLRSKSLLASDIFDIATHAMLGRSAAPLLLLLPSLLQAGAEVWAQVVETSSLLMAFGLDEGQFLPFADPSETAAFRILQLRIAIEAGHRENVAKIVQRSVIEFDKNNGSDPSSTRFLELLFLWQLLQHRTEMALADRLLLSLRFADVSEHLSKVLMSWKEKGTLDLEDESFPSLTTFIPMTLIPAVANVDDLDELLDLMDGLDSSGRARALCGFSRDQETSALALDRVWLGEAKLQEPRWSKLAATLWRLRTMAGDLGAPAMSEAAAALLVRVTDENMQDPATALARADMLIAEMGSSPRVLAAKARVLWRRGSFHEALDLYDKAIPHFSLGLSWKTDVLRDAGVTAGKASNWPLSAQRLTEALSSLSNEEPLVRRVGLLFDLAIAEHLSGRRRDAVDHLGDAVELMADDDQKLPTEPLLSVRQLGSQIIKTIGAEFGYSGLWRQGEMPLTRLFGATSGLEELTWGDQQPASLDVIMLIMAELDILMPGRPTYAERLGRRLRTTTDLLVQCTQGDMQTRLAVRLLDMKHGVSDAIQEARAISFAAAERDAGRELEGRPLSESAANTLPMMQELVQWRLLARIVAMIAQDQAEDIPVDLWLADLPTDGSMAEVAAMLEDLRRLLAGSADASSRIMGGNTTWTEHLLAGLMAPIQRELSPDQLLICHVVAAQYLKQARLREFVAVPFAEWVSRVWLEVCEKPYQLATPRLTVPGIRAAATQTPPNWSRTLSVLEAARGAVSSSTRFSVNEALKTLRSDLMFASQDTNPGSR